MNVSALASTVALTAMLAIPAMAQDRPSTLGSGVAPMGVADPYMMIYRVPGVHSTFHVGDEGFATVFSCHNNSSETEKIRFRIFNFNGILERDVSYDLPRRWGIIAATHRTKVFVEDIVLTAGIGIAQGVAAIIATSREIFCTAMIVDAAATVPNGIALHMVRFNPAPGSVE